MEYVVYRHTSPSGYVYIGQTCNIERRFGKRGLNYIGCHIFYNAIKKYGWNNFKHEILFEHLTKNEADEIERKLISHYKKIGVSYNIADGGGGVAGIKWSADSRAKASKSAKNRCKDPLEVRRLVKNLKKNTLSEESRKRISEKNSGKNNPMYGKHRSEEVKKKISEKLKGRHLSEETKDKISLYLKEHGHPMQGRHHTEETKNKISIATKGRQAHNKGKKMSDEQKKKISLKNSGVIKICNADGVCKKIRPDELESYLSLGWQRGQKWKL